MSAPENTTPSPRAARLAETSSERLLCLLACPLLVLTPFAVFLKHHDYALARPEVLVAAAILIAAAMPFGVLAAIVPPAVRIVPLGVLVALFAEIQIGWIDSWNRYLATLAIVLLVLYGVRQRAVRTITLLVGVMFVATLPMPGGSGWVQVSRGEHVAEGDSDLPLVIHILLDEQIGVEGIPAHFDPGGSTRKLVEELFLEWNFQLFSRAFTRYYETRNSLSHILSLSSDPPGIVRAGHSRPERNVYFETMARRGHRIHVHQSDYFDFCTKQGDFEVDSCSIYTLESVKAIEDAPLQTGEKTDVMLGMFVRLSTVLTDLRATYGDITRRLAERGVALPEWPEEVGRVSALTAMRMLDTVEPALAQAKPGEFHFVHLMLPHFPFAYDTQCRLRSSPRTWLTSFAPETYPRRNDAETRRQRYPKYLQQVACTMRRLDTLFANLDDAGVLEDALVIVHGDHGSRIDTGPPFKRFARKLKPSDYVDAYSTVFAVHTPGGRARFDRRLLPVGSLLNALVRKGSIPAGVDWAGPRNVYLHVLHGQFPDPDKARPSRRMPNFGAPRAAERPGLSTRPPTSKR